MEAFGRQIMNSEHIEDPEKRSVNIQPLSISEALGIDVM